MLNNITRILNKDDALLKHSSILLISGLITNLLNYLFQFYMGRALGPSEYGIFGSLLALIYIFSVPTQTINTVVAKYISKFKENNENIIIFLKIISRKVIINASFFFLFYILLSPFIGKFLRINDLATVSALGIVIFFQFINPIISGSLTGMQRFKQLGLTQIYNALFKLLFGILFILLGYTVGGAILAIAIGFIISILSGLYFLRDIDFGSEYDKIGSFKEVKPYLYNVLLVVFFLQLFFNVDMILVKRFFSSEEAGYYTSISILGKLIFFGTTAVLGAFFPKVSAYKARGTDTNKILNSTIFYVGGLGILLVLLFNLIPNFIIQMIYGNEYSPAGELLGLYSVGVLLFALTNVFVQYCMALERMSFISLLTIGAIFEVGGIVLFHSSLIEVIRVFTLSMALIFLGMFLTVRKYSILPVK